MIDDNQRLHDESQHLHARKAFRQDGGRGLALAAGALVLLLAVVSCQTVNRAVVVLPDVPGAKYIGSKECEQCHDKLYRDFATADHARLIAAGAERAQRRLRILPRPRAACTRSQAARSKPPFSFTAGRPQPASFGARVARPAGPREGNGLLPMPSQRARPVQPAQPSSGAGRANSPAPTAIRRTKAPSTSAAAPRLLSENENCFRCHAAQRGPYVFEHDALREGCTTCHNVHGSVNAKLLTVRDANLCLKCHFQQVSGGQLLIGGSDHTVARAARHLLDRGLPRGGPWLPGQPLLAVLTTNANADESPSTLCRIKGMGGAGRLCSVSCWPAFALLAAETNAPPGGRPSPPAEAATTDPPAGLTNAPAAAATTAPPRPTPPP